MRRRVCGSWMDGAALPNLLLAAALFETYISYDSLRSHTARSNSSFPETFGLGESRGSAFGDSRLSLASRLENKRLPPTASRVHLNLRFAVRVAGGRAATLGG